MIDYSFLRLKDSLSSALDIQDSPVTTHYFFNPIQLLPNKKYLQITNFDGGISLDSDCEVFVVDCNDNVLADITDNVFIEEFTDSQGNNQCKIELINLGVDFYRQTVLLKFDMLSSDAVFYTNPINITSYQSERTVYFEYGNYDDFFGIGYTNANVTQSISLGMYFDIPLDETETEDYFQISRNNTISARALYKTFEQYKVEQINRFTFERLNVLLKHERIYLDNVRVTNKPVVNSSERLGDSNYFETDFAVAKNYKDTKEYESQIFEGIVFNYEPLGLYCTGYQIEAMAATANVPLILNTGTLSVYTDAGVLVDTFTQADMVIQSGNQLKIITTGSNVELLANGSYYVVYSEGLVSGLGVLNSALTDDTVWTFTLADGDYSSLDYSNDYFTCSGSAPNPIVDNLVLFYKFNETSGTTAVDSSTSGTNGTINNVNINQAGLIDRCYQFNNGTTNEYVEIPDVESLSFGNGSFSIELWIDNSANFGRILNKYNATTGDLEYRLFLQSGVLQFFIYTDASNRIGIADNASLGVGWNQVVVTYSPANGLQMKVNNTVASFSPIETGTYAGMPNTTQPVILGQQADDLTGSNRYSGLMDILRIWKGYELTDSDITTLYNSGNGTET